MRKFPDSLPLERASLPRAFIAIDINAAAVRVTLSERGRSVFGRPGMAATGYGRAPHDIGAETWQWRTQMLAFFRFGRPAYHFPHSLPDAVLESLRTNFIQNKNK